MKINKSLYPYPVISDFNDDYKGSSFRLEYELLETGYSTRSLKSKFILTDKKLLEMIENKTAHYVLHVECPLTSFRESYNLNDTNEIITLNDENFSNLVEVNGLIVLNNDLEYYKNCNFNSDFYGDNYVIKNLRKGSILGVTLTQEIRIISENNIREDIPSIINVAISNNPLMSVDLDSDVILIKLPKKEYERYIKLSGTIYSDIILSAIFYPAIIYALDNLSSNLVGDLNLDWCKVFESKLNEKNISIDDINKKHSSVELAQKILENPIERSLVDLEKEIERDEIL